MEKTIINKLRKIKQLNKENYKQIIRNEVDLENENVINSDVLKMLLWNSKIDEIITDIIFIILDTKITPNEKK